MGSKLAIDVTAQTTQATKNIQNISDKITELASRKNSITGVSASFVAVSAAAQKVQEVMQKVIEISKEFIDLYSNQALTEKRLDVILKNVSTDAQMSTKSLKDYASALQLVTRYGDETIITVEQILLETGKLNKDGLEKATELSLDLAEAMGTDATSAAQTLALALQDPEAGLTRLRKAHVTFSEAEEQTIREMIAQGRELEAQEAILDKVADTYGGLAREIGAVDVSKIDKIQNLLGDIKEDLGGRILDTISPALETLYGWLLKIKEWSDPYVHNTDAGVDISKKLSRDIGFFGGYWSDQISGKRDFLTPNTTNNNVYNRLLGDLYAEAEKTKVSWEALEKLHASYKRDLDSLGGNTGATLSDGTTYEEAYKRYLGLHALIQDAKTTGKYKTADAADDILRIANSVNAVPSGSTPAASISAQLNEGGWIDAEFWQEEVLKMAPSGTFEVPVSVVLEPEIKDEDKVDIIPDPKSWDQNLNEFVNDYFEKRIDAVVSSTAKALNNISGLINQLYDNEISALDRQLSEMEEKWDKYFASLDKKYKKDKDNLDAMYESGQMSAEEYERELAKMDAERVKSEQDKDDELKKLQAKKQELERKQFEASKANQIAQATIAGAQSIAGIWASSGAYGVAGPAIAAALTAISAAAVGAQIATIASQQYVPALAEGGIVSKPTLALIGEAGPEAVVPLSKGYGGMTVVVQVENVYTSDDLSEAVYEGISKLQKTGALPAWS